METIKKYLGLILSPLLLLLKPIIKKELEDKILAPQEKKIIESEGKVDDALGLPAIAAIRKLLADW